MLHIIRLTSRIQECYHAYQSIVYRCHRSTLIDWYGSFNRSTDTGRPYQSIECRTKAAVGRFIIIRLESIDRHRSIHSTNRSMVSIGYRSISEVTPYETQWELCGSTSLTCQHRRVRRKVSLILGRGRNRREIRLASSSATITALCVAECCS